MSNLDNWAELVTQFCCRNQRALHTATHMTHSNLDKFCLQVDKSIILISSIEQNYHPCTVDIIILNRTGVLFERWETVSSINHFLQLSYKWDYR